MELELRDCLKYYPSELETYLFEEVSNNFRKNHHLTPEEFFAIILWKRKPSGIKIALGWENKAIKYLTGELYAADDEEKLSKLTSVNGIGVAIASAILSVCYPEKFTVLDYRALNSLWKKEPEICSAKNLPPKVEKFKPEDYFNYVNICNEVWKKYSSSLREFDRSLWAMDWYEGESGLLDVVDAYSKKVER